MNSHPLYIEITQSALRLLLNGARFEQALERTPGGRLVASTKARVSDALQSFLKSNGWQSKAPAWCAIDARGVSLRRFALPATTKENFSNVLRLQVESEFPLSPDQLA